MASVVKTESAKKRPPAKSGGSKKVQGAISKKIASEKKRSPGRDLDAKLLELETRIEKLEKAIARYSFAVLGQNVVCMDGEEPLFVLPKATRDDVAFLFVMEQEETKEALLEVREWRKQRSDAGNRD